MKFIALCWRGDGEKRLCGMKVEVGLHFHQHKNLGTGQEPMKRA